MTNIFADLLNTNNVLSVLALIVALCSMYVAFQTWLLKRGHKVRGAYYIRSSSDSSCTYINKVILENLKDRDLVIYNIYIKCGKNIYIDMLSRNVTDDENLHIIPGLSTRQFIFGPPYMSVDNSYIIDLSELLNKYSYKHGKIVLLTSSGRINVKRSCEFEKTPLVDYFKNYGTRGILQYRYPSQSSTQMLGGLPAGAIDYSSYGDRIKYIVRLKFRDSREVEYRIFKQLNDKVVFFKDTIFTEECLESEDSLIGFLEKEKKEGRLIFEEVVSVVNLQEVIKKQKEHLLYYPNKLEPEGWYQYYICDWLQTKWYNFIDKEHRRLKS